MTDYYMAFTYDEEPLGLLQINEEGQFVRGLEQWFPLSPDNEHFDNVEVVNVSEEFVPFFDMLDAKEDLPTYKQTKKYVIVDEEEITNE